MLGQGIRDLDLGLTIKANKQSGPNKYLSHKGMDGLPTHLASWDMDTTNIYKITDILIFVESSTKKK